NRTGSTVMPGQAGLRAQNWISRVGSVRQPKPASGVVTAASGALPPAPPVAGPLFPPGTDLPVHGGIAQVALRNGGWVWSVPQPVGARRGTPTINVATTAQ